MSIAFPRSVRVSALAKINLTLRVLGIRDDGYHELRTTFQSVALHDTLTFTRVTGPFRIETNDPTCPVDDSNLVWKAAARLWAAAARRGEMRGVHVRLHKRIPSQAGLGGGSSDAAAALRALRHLWKVAIPEGELGGLAAELGADVPYFLFGGTMLGVERGDLLFPLVDLPSAWVVIARPAVGVSTRDAYGWWDESFRSAGARGATHAVGLATDVGNDLEPPVVARHPGVRVLVRRLRALGASRAAMSGSGSAVFATFDTADAAERAAAAVSGRDVRSWVTRTVGRASYRRRSAARVAAG